MFTPAFKNQFLCFSVLCAFSSAAFSANGHFYLSTSLGDSFANISKSSPQISYFSGAVITDDYSLDSKNTSAPIFGVNGGYEFALADGHWKPAIALGLGVYTTPADYVFNGAVTETPDGDPSETLYKYTYNINSTRLMAEVQFTWMLGMFAPFINFGAGPVWNKQYAYDETAITPEGYVPLPAFQAHTNVNFAYQAGVGISTAFNFAGDHADSPQERIALGYRYVNLGTTSFGTRGVDYPYSLNTGTLQTNEVYLSFTHLF